MKKISLLILEDNNESLLLFKTYAERVFPIIFQAKTCSEAHKILAENDISIIIADHFLPDGLGLDIIKELQIYNPETLAVLVSGRASKQLVIDAVNNGVTYFLEKPVDVEELTSFLQECIESIRDLDNKKEIWHRFKASPVAITCLKNKYKITTRELQIIDMILCHRESKIVAQVLGISPGTIKRHSENIYLKLKISSKSELIDLIFKINKNV